MFCCEVQSTISDTASVLKKTAYQDVKRREIVSNLFVLTSCVNPYAIDKVVVVKNRNSYKVYDCGILVFHMVYTDLKKYICGDWSNKLANEVKAIQAQKQRVKAKDRLQLILNTKAAENYITC
jgi:hypothetical protein